MRIDHVIINASPLIALDKSGQETLLPQLFDKIHIPDAVWNEIHHPAHGLTPHFSPFYRAPWIQRITVPTILPEIAAWNLGAGESAVLTAAVKTPNSRALIDDRAARRCTKACGVQTLGTISLLLLAKKRGIISNVGNRITLLKEAGLWLSEGLVELTLRKAGEQ